ncbi:hypothetical protein WH96_04160 [Kiloniella spongiae]|uniref:PAS domain-containing protein n=1 Tax=Kiloniella spongiae TaxID=1489064 RepID=A0A0H2MXZ1_9PROT|nr:PAS domain-containing protein [Kiloniella spongiae]KLN61565.1 hypothetical protein WH96_04160 [Kiloniella spongiae]
MYLIKNNPKKYCISNDQEAFNPEIKKCLSNTGSLITEFTRYWSSLPKVGFIPDRDDFLPERIPGLLPNIVVLEPINRDFLKLRLVGSAIETRFNQRNLGGQNYLDFVRPIDRSNVSQAIFSMIEYPMGLLANLQMGTCKGVFSTGNLIAFPVRNANSARCLIYILQDLPVQVNYSNQDVNSLFVINGKLLSYIDIGAGVPASIKPI